VTVLGDAFAQKMIQRSKNCVRVEQNYFGVCDKPIPFSTNGLGNCIGVCIAWKTWAAILHSAQIELDEDDVVLPMIAQAKDVIPRGLVLRIRPVICGGDTFHDRRAGGNPKEFVSDVLRYRKRVVEVLKEAGFGEPHVRWNELRETTSLVANLKRGVVYIIENDIGEVGKWRICQRSA
jgi:hypothetical protein